MACTLAITMKGSRFPKDDMEGGSSPKRRKIGNEEEKLASGMAEPDEVLPGLHNRYSQDRISRQTSQSLLLDEIQRHRMGGRDSSAAALLVDSSRSSMMGGASSAAMANRLAMPASAAASPVVQVQPSWHFTSSLPSAGFDPSGLMFNSQALVVSAPGGVVRANPPSLSAAYPGLLSLQQQHQQQQAAIALSQQQQDPIARQALAQARAIAVYQNTMSSGAAFPSLIGSAGLTLPPNMLDASSQQRINSLDVNMANSVLSAGMVHHGALPNSTEGARKLGSSLSSAPSDGIRMTLPSDEDNLSEYQCMIRQHIELFSAKVRDIECNAQGRNKPIVVGQVGIRCRGCASIPPGRRPRGAVYFPAKLPGLYQAAQNMALNHFQESCQSISESKRERMVILRERRNTILGGGKQYWANGARVLGIRESDNGLVFEKDYKSDSEE